MTARAITAQPPVSVALLTNFVPPTRLPAIATVASRAPTTVFVDTEMESNRNWQVDHTGLQVQKAPGWTLRKTYRHSAGYSEEAYVHFPISLFWRLWRTRPSHIMSGELGFRSAVACLYKLLRPQTRLLFWVEGTPHTDLCRGALRGLWRRILLRFPDGAFATSTGARDLLALYGAGDLETYVSFLASGYGPPDDAIQRTTEQRQRLLCAGQLIERKGLRPFMTALCKVAAEDKSRPVEIWFAGSGPEEAWLRELPASENLKLKILGSVGFKEMQDIYRQCGILAFPTLADVWGLVANEAMAYSMPVLGSVFAQSVCDLVDDSTGWTFRPDDQAGTESAIRRALATDAATLESMGARARQTVETITPEAFGRDMAAALLEPELKA